LDWKRVLELARHHGVIPQLSEAVEHFQTAIPHAIVERVRVENRKNTQQALWFTREMFRILEQLKSRNVDAIPYKGPVLAELLYGSITARQYNDIDILIRPRDVHAAVAVLHQLGYKPAIELTPQQQRAYLRSGYEHTFDGEQGRNLVELQWNILPRFYSVDLKTDELFTRSRTTTFGAQEIRSLCPEDLMLVLCLHAAKHGWVQLSWLADIAVLAQRPIDWNEINQRCEALGVRRIVGLTLALCHRLWKTEPGRFQADRQSAALLNEQLEMLAAGKEFESESMRYFRRMLQARERRSDQVRFIWRLATTPSLGEWSSFRLPLPFSPLYRAVRVFRLARRLFG